VTFYLEWTLGEDREQAQSHVTTRWDPESKTLVAANPYHPDDPQRLAFATMSPAPEAYTADRTEFLGRNQDLTRPAALRRLRLSGRAGPGLDPCAALQLTLQLAPGQTREVTCLLGQAGSLEEAQHLVLRYRDPLVVQESLERTRQWWDERLGRIQVELPDLSATFLLNRWLLYQTLSCRLWARTGLYQSSGAYGFRDQLQDAMALVVAAPEFARRQILVAAGRQFVEGDVQHWWHPPSGEGTRTRISDDLLWLPYALAHYVTTTGDVALLDEQVPFLQGAALGEAAEAFLAPDETIERASVYEHARRAIERGLTAGRHGLPLMGTGDWNDAMNRVGADGRGESVWLAWFLMDVLRSFAELAEQAGHSDDAAEYLQQAKRLAEVVEREAWDGDWYLRAFFDDGTPLGSAASQEARIDSLPQAWSALNGMGDPSRQARALDSAWEHLVREDEGLALLLTPPFDRTSLEPGYIKGYPPGVRENGGQYTHAAVWLAMAFARRGDGDRAVRLLRLLNPVEHARDPASVARYRVEPYAVAADVYRLEGSEGRGGWTWYTGSAAWMYRAWIEAVLGFRLRGGRLTLDPVLPKDWDGFRMRYAHGEAVYEITVENPDRVGRGVAWVEMDGRRLDGLDIPLENSPIKHKVRVRMGLPVP
jgi:cyclic beta-1,2-glucan synthetase